MPPTTGMFFHAMNRGPCLRKGDPVYQDTLGRLTQEQLWEARLWPPYRGAVSERSEGRMTFEVDDKHVLRTGTLTRWGTLVESLALLKATAKMLRRLWERRDA